MLKRTDWRALQQSADDASEPVQLGIAAPMKATFRVVATVAIFCVSFIVYLFLAAPLWNLTGHLSESTPPPIAFRVTTYVGSLILALWTTRRLVRRFLPATIPPGSR